MKKILYFGIMVFIVIALSNMVFAILDCEENEEWCARENICISAVGYVYEDCLCNNNYKTCNNFCVNTDIDSANCGNCNIKCDSDEKCSNGDCVPKIIKPALVCGNEIWQPENNEECDTSVFGDMSGNLCSVYNPTEYSSGTLKCTSDTCKIDFSGCNYCGDYDPDYSVEECDEGPNGNIGSGLYGVDTTYCDSSCHNFVVSGLYCGDGICQENNENNLTCFRDCFKDGWTTENKDGWSYNGVLHASAPGLKLTSTYTVDIKADVDYTLSYKIFKNDGCTVIFGFNDGYCTSAIDFTQKPCFSDYLFQLNHYDLTTGKGTESIFIKSNKNATNEEYFKDVKFNLFTTGTCTDVNISDISLVESTYNSDAIYYDSEIPDKTLSTGCCPINYCWDGEKCQNSDQWMTNASLPGIWNLMNISEWNNNHVNTSSQFKGVSYRCVIVNNDTNEAQWVASYIKYDWNYEASGYCANENDCFVNDTYNQDVSNYSKGCIHHGDVISEDYIFGEGNHYCHKGNWTTKSYIVASFLQNISTDKDYSLHCYDNSFITYNSPEGYTDASNILSSCILIQKDTPNKNKDRIITGIIFKNSESVDDADNGFLDQLVNEYNTLYPASIISDIEYTCLTNPSIKTCVAKESRDANPIVSGLYVYYDVEYDYMLISDQPIDGLFVPTMWDKISGWFKDIFSNNDIISIPYTSINYTTSYDKIYILRENTVNVTAVEEAKYDELENAIATLFYVKYVGSNPDNNPLYNDTIYKTIKEIKEQKGQGVAVGVSVSNKSDPLEQELIIKSQDKTGLWQYFTSAIRTR